MGEDNASWFPLNLIRCRCSTAERGIFYYKRFKFRVYEVTGKKGGRQWLESRTVLDKKAGADQSGKLVSLNNSALN